MRCFSLLDSHINLHKNYKIDSNIGRYTFPFSTIKLKLRKPDSCHNWPAKSTTADQAPTTKREIGILNVAQPMIALAGKIELFCLPPFVVCVCVSSNARARTRLAGWYYT